MYTKMNHSSEWAKFFDELAGCYHQKQKGRVGCGSRNPYGHRESVKKKGGTNVTKTVAKVAAEKTGKITW